MQIINKKCPYCSAIFKVKSALESHLQAKHPDKQMINIDAIPEITFNASFSPQQQQQQQQQLEGDFWKARLMQQPQTSGLFPPQRRSDFSESEVSFTDSNNEELPDEDCEIDNFNDDEEMGTAGLSENQKSKRHRTHVNRAQKSILRKIFDDIKNPSMIDCENIGKEIGLFKRVVQVWFQNARANFKKFHKITTNDLKQLPERNPSECNFCPDYVPIPGKSFHLHAISQQHIQNIHAYVLKNEAIDDDDEDNFNAFEGEMIAPRGELNFGNNLHEQKQQGVMVGDMHWMD